MDTASDGIEAPGKLCSGRESGSGSGVSGVHSDAAACRN